MKKVTLTRNTISMFIIFSTLCMPGMEISPKNTFAKDTLCWQAGDFTVVPDEIVGIVIEYLLSSRDTVIKEIEKYKLSEIGRFFYGVRNIAPLNATCKRLYHCSNPFILAHVRAILKENKIKELFFISRQGSIIELCIKVGANINQLNNDHHLLAWAAHYESIEKTKQLLDNGADVNVRDERGLRALDVAVRFGYLELGMVLINPVARLTARKKIETLLIIYNQDCSLLSLLPKGIVKIIITCAHPEFAMDRELISFLHPQILVDTVPLEVLSTLINDGTLNQESIFGAWQQKLICINNSIKVSYGIRNARQRKRDFEIKQRFKTYALTQIEALLTIK